LGNRGIARVVTVLVDTDDVRTARLIAAKNMTIDAAW
jgi:hypothetical protein